MRRLLHPALAAALAASVACGGSPPSTPAPPGSSAETITGRERVGWTQTAGSAADLAAYRYAMYVDGQRRIIEGHTCTPAASGTTSDCSAPLPPLGAGRHTLEVAAFLTSGDDVVEGPRSPVLQVTVAGIVAPADPESVVGGEVASSDGVRLHADIVARELSTPVDLAIAPDGRVLVAERGGRVHVVDPGNTARSPADDDNVLIALGEAPAPDLVTLRALAVSPDFAQSGLVYVAYVTSDRGGSLVRIARVRERGGRFGEAAAIAAIPVARPDASVVLRPGPDGNLYLAIGGQTSDVDQNPSAEAGRILRLRSDGTTPEDNPTRSPVLSAGHGDLRGLAWVRDDKAVWNVQRDEQRDTLSRIEPGADSTWPLLREAPRPGVLLLPPDSDPSGLTAVNASGSAWLGDLIVSTLGSEDLLRIRITPEGTLRLRARLLQRRFGPIAQVAAAPDGSLYFVTANERTWGQGHEFLIRLRPPQ